MRIDRRAFLLSTVSLAASQVLGNSLFDEKKKGSLKAFGMQLYTLRDEMSKDPITTMAALSKIGYKQLEGYQGTKGILWGMTPAEFKQRMSDWGMTMVSTHCNTDKGFEKNVEEAVAVGLKYLISPWIGPQKSLDEYKKMADRFNELGKICKAAGLRFAYHNHDYSFKPMDGKIPQEIMMDNTDPELVDFEMDIHWVVRGGQDPIAYLNKYPNRFRLCHVKDVAKEAPYHSCDLGTGSLDFSKILKIAADKGMKYYIVEQEEYGKGTPMKSAETDFSYLKSLKFA